MMKNFIPFLLIMASCGETYKIKEIDLIERQRGWVTIPIRKRSDIVKSKMVHKVPKSDTLRIKMLKILAETK
jgi:hypothetical protein